MSQSKYIFTKENQNLKLTIYLNNSNENIVIIIPSFMKEFKNNDIYNYIKSENINMRRY
jgi:hypothetical protein